MRLLLKIKITFEFTQYNKFVVGHSSRYEYDKQSEKN